MFVMPTDCNWESMLCIQSLKLQNYPNNCTIEPLGRGLNVSVGKHIQNSIVRGHMHLSPWRRTCWAVWGRVSGHPGAWGLEKMGGAVGPWEHGVGEGGLGADAELRLRCWKLMVMREWEGLLEGMATCKLIPTLFHPLSQGLLLRRTGLGWGEQGQEEQEWKPLGPSLPPLLRANLGLRNQRRGKRVPHPTCLPTSKSLGMQLNGEVSSFKMWRIE